MSGPKSQSDETKRKLIAATKHLLAERGWSAVSNRAIADKAAVNLALISYHFGSKSGLLAATIDDAVDALSSQMHELSRHSSLADFAHKAIASVPEMAQDLDSRVLATAMLEATHDTEVASTVSRNLREFRSALRVLGERTGADNSTGQAILVAALLDGLFLHALVDPTTDIAAASSALGLLLED
jgi:AcrR family transcriptional regulator